VRQPPRERRSEGATPSGPSDSQVGAYLWVSEKFLLDLGTFVRGFKIDPRGLNEASRSYEIESQGAGCDLRTFLGVLRAP
jgi:hypothetical protein